jgi:hypothetical protein
MFRMPLVKPLMSSTELNPHLGYSCAGSGRPRGSISGSAMTARIAFALPVDVNNRLWELAKREDIPVSKIIRRAIVRELDFWGQF